MKIAYSVSFFRITPVVAKLGYIVYIKLRSSDQYNLFCKFFKIKLFLWHSTTFPVGEAGYSCARVL